MKVNKKSWLILIGVTSLIGGCALVDKLEGVITPEKNIIEKTVAKTKTVSLACKRGNIKDYEEKGWKVIDSEEKEIPCTWKTKKARPGCNLEKDKGCRITVPDKMGKEIIYTLEKLITVENR